MERTIGLIAILSVLVVGVVGTIGLTKELTGATTTTTTNPQSKYCDCYMQQFDYMGNSLGIHWTNEFRVKTAMQHTDVSCNNRCKQMNERGKSHGTKKRSEVVGYARPAGEPRGSGWHP